MTLNLPPFHGATVPLAFETLPVQVSAGVPLDLSLTVSSSHPSNQLVVERRSNGLEQVPVRAWPDGVDPVSGTQRFRVRMPALVPGEAAEFVPVLTRAGLLIERLPARSTQGVQAPAAQAVLDGSPAMPAPTPRYQWASEFLGALTVQLAKPPESTGPAPDGIHIVYGIESGQIRGPKINGKVRGGDWIRLRRDGIGIAAPRITCETDDGAVLVSSYSGVVDFGPDGYDRAQRNDFDAHPPVVLTPQFTTAHPDWLWVNRLQCLGVGRVSMADSVVRFDIYAIRVGQALASSGLSPPNAPILAGDIR
jgi:Protein of unknown function (DUF3237)